MSTAPSINYERQTCEGNDGRTLIRFFWGDSTNLDGISELTGDGRIIHHFITDGTQHLLASNPPDGMILRYDVTALNGSVVRDVNEMSVFSDGKTNLAIVETLRASYERTVTLDANGGMFADGTKTAKNRIVDATDIMSTDNPPTRAGQRIVSWNTKPDGSGDDVANLGTNLKDGATIYAQWGPEPGKPTKAMVDCGRRNPKMDGVACRVAVDYANAPSEYRDLQAMGDANIAWSGKPIDGVKLDGTGYAISTDCVDASADGKRDAQCYSVSLTAAPPTANGATITQTPTTGTPMSDMIWPAITIGSTTLLGLSLSRRRTTRKA